MGTLYSASVRLHHGSSLIVAELAGEAWCSNDDDPSMISLQETGDLTAPADQATSLSATGSFVTFDEQVILEVSTGK
jgi:hypothetical protein